MGNDYARKQRELAELDTYIRSLDFEPMYIEDNILDHPYFAQYLNPDTTSKKQPDLNSGQFFALTLLAHIIRNLRKDEFVLDYETLFSMLKGILISENANSSQQSLTHESIEDLPPKFADNQSFIKRLFSSFYNIQHLAGDLIISRLKIEFEILSELGSGAFGEVVIARNKLDSKEYAIKKIEIKTEANTDKLVREIRVLSTLVHKNVVRYHTAWVDFEDKKLPDPAKHNTYEEKGDDLKPPATPRHESSPLDEIKPITSTQNFSLAKCAPTHPEVFPILCILLELCESNLKEWLLERNARCSTFWDLSQGDLENSDDFTVQLFQGLSYIHSKGYIHRDIKPSNILLSENSKVIKIGDFGLSKNIDGHHIHLNSSRMRNLTTYTGTEIYASPEQRSSCTEYTNKVDIFSSALVMLELYCPSPNESERDDKIEYLREGGILAEFKQDFPLQSKLILRMVNIDWDKRPSADEILYIFLASRKVTRTDLKQIIALRDKRIAELEAEIRELTK